MFFLALRLFTALANFITFRYLPSPVSINTPPKVSVLVPARNEENNISILLNQLKEFTYANLEVIVYNDNSTDKTAETVMHWAKEDSRIRLINGAGLPEGWLGKNNACHQLALQAKGEFFLFLDADVIVAQGLIESALLYIKKHNLHLLSIFPKQIFKSFGEKLAVPLMNWILLSFLPLILIRLSGNPAFSAANGQFMLFRADTYKRTLPHKVFKAHKVEDIATIQYFKKLGLKSDTLLGNKFIQCRMYSGAREAIEGFTKNIFQFFGNSVVATIMVGLLLTIAPAIVYVYLGFLPAIIYLAGILLIRIFVSLASKQSLLQNLLLMIPQHIVFLLIIAKGIINKRKKELIWKGRNVI